MALYYFIVYLLSLSILYISMLYVAADFSGSNLALTMILYGDIGGTKTQLAFASDTTHLLPGVSIFANDNFPSLYSLLDSFLATAERPISKAYFSVAGPVHDNQCQLTNLDWNINGSDIAKHFNINHVELINDLSATAYAVPKLEKKDFEILQNSPPKLENGPIAVLSVGTGLGESVLIWDTQLQRYKTIAGEGGHRDFAPHNEMEIDLLKYVVEKSGTEHFDTEKLISGNGIVSIYNYLCDTHPEHLNKREKNLHYPWQIVSAAKESPQNICQQTIEMLANLIATEASNVALQYLSAGGVIISGGIPPKICEYLTTQNFLDRFCDKGKFSDWLQSIPIAICKNYQAPLIGAQYYSSLS